MIHIIGRKHNSPDTHNFDDNAGDVIKRPMHSHHAMLTGHAVDTDFSFLHGNTSGLCPGTTVITYLCDVNIETLPRTCKPALTGGAFCGWETTFVSCVYAPQHS